MVSNHKSFGDRLRLLRERSNKSVPEIAAALKKTPQAYYSYEKGNCSIKTLFKIANILNVNVIDFFIDSPSETEVVSAAECKTMFQTLLKKLDQQETERVQAVNCENGKIKSSLMAST
jgi:transcriptional regulator with XRE-family HTH domain